jgi:hypothetical protein
VHAEEECLQEARQAEGGGDADEDAGQRQAHPLEHHHVLHLADLRSEGEADADLVCPLLDGVGHQAGLMARIEQSTSIKLPLVAQDCPH